MVSFIAIIIASCVFARQVVSSQLGKSVSHSRVAGSAALRFYDHHHKTMQKFTV